MSQEIEKIKEAFGYAVAAVGANLNSVLTFFGVMWVVRDVLLYVGLFSPLTGWVAVVALLGVLALILGDMMKLNLALKITTNQSVGFRDLWDGPMTTLRYILGWLIYNIMVLMGLVLFILPGLWLICRFQFWGFYVVDRKAGVVTALKESFVLTEGKGKYLALSLIPMALAWVVVAPVALMAHVFSFRKYDRT